jgi:thioredoxin-related protein
MSFLLALFIFSANAAPNHTLVGGEDVLTLKPVEIAPGSKGLVVVFLSAICPCSNSHLSELKALATEFPQFHFVGVHSNTDETKATTQDYFRAAALPFPVIQDSAGKLAAEYKANKTPHAFVVNPNGEIVFRGGVSDSHIFSESHHKYLREALTDLHNGRAVATAEVRSLGCAISRSGNNVW